MIDTNIGNVGVNLYQNSYTNSIQNRDNEKKSESFTDKIVETVNNSSLTDLNSIMFPGDVTISYPPSLTNVSYNSAISEKSKTEMTLDEYKQWVMNEISQMPVSGWVRSTYSSGATVIKEEAFERMKSDPEYENYVLNRVRSAYSVRSLPVGSNNVSYDVIGASPEECYGYAGPVGKSDLETINDGETWWEKRHKKMEELLEEQMEKSQREHLARSQQAEEEYLRQVYANRQKMYNLLNKSFNENVDSNNSSIQSLMEAATSVNEKNIEVPSSGKI